MVRTGHLVLHGQQLRAVARQLTALLSVLCVLRALGIPLRKGIFVETGVN